MQLWQLGAKWVARRAPAHEVAGPHRGVLLDLDQEGRKLMGQVFDLEAES